MHNPLSMCCGGQVVVSSAVLAQWDVPVPAEGLRVVALLPAAFFEGAVSSAATSAAGSSAAASAAEGFDGPASAAGAVVAAACAAWAACALPRPLKTPQYTCTRETSVL